MSHPYYDIAVTPKVAELQEQHGSRAAYARVSARGNDRIGAPEAAFITERDGFYIASVSETGWPYVQFRGGPPGFVRVLDETTLAWADFRGNQQFLTAGNIRGDDRVALIFMDYAHRRRVKVYGRLRYSPVDEEPDLAQRLAIPGYRAKVDRIARLEVVAWDRNCPQHIPRRYTLQELGLPSDHPVPAPPAGSSR
jgi:hypothetical protein